MIDEWTAITDIHTRTFFNQPKDIIVISNLLAIPKDKVAFDYRLSRRFIIKNPYYTGMSAMEAYDKIPEIKQAGYLKFYAVKNNFLLVPIYAPVKDLLLTHNINYDDRRIVKPDIKNIHFDGELRDYQEAAASQWLKKKCGIIQARTGSGKTVLALYLIAHCKKRAVVLVHTKLLQDQWYNTAHRFLESVKIATTQDKDYERADILIATYQWFFRNMEKKARLLQHFPFLIADEVHRVSAPMFFRTVLLSPARYRIGLTATPYRTDGLFPIVHWLLGKDLITATDPTLWRANVYIVDTERVYPSTSFLSDTRKQIAHLKSRITKDKERMRMLLDIMLALYKRGKYAIIATPTRKMVDELYDNFIKQEGVNPDDVGAIHSQRKKKERQNIKLKQIIIATTEIIMEGFDLPRLDCLVNATPFSSKLLHVQIIGRILRHATGKSKPMIVDLHDHDKDGILQGLVKKRIKTYQEEGHDIVGYFTVDEFIDTINRGDYKRALLPEDEVL